MDIVAESQTPYTTEDLTWAANLLLLECEAETRAVWEECYARGAEGIVHTYGNVALLPDPQTGNVPQIVVRYKPSEGYSYFGAPFENCIFLSSIVNRDVAVLAIRERGIKVPS